MITGTRDFSLFQSFQKASGVHPASYTIDRGGSYPGGKAGHSLPSSAEIRNI
jgi:hypothetical protein